MSTKNTRNGQQEDDKCTETMKIGITSKATLSEAEVMLIQLEVATRLTGSAADRKRKRSRETERIEEIERDNLLRSEQLKNRELKRKQEQEKLEEEKRGRIYRPEGVDTLSMLPTATAIDNSLENLVKPL